MTTCAYKVIKPNGGQKWPVGERRRIKWASYGPLCSDTVKIQYSINGGKRWKKVKKHTPNDGVQKWLVPNTPTSRAKVKVTDILNSAYYDISDKRFSIISSTSTTSYSSAETEVSVEDTGEASELRLDGTELDVETGLVDLNPEDVAGEEEEGRFGCMMTSEKVDPAGLWSMLVIYGLPVGVIWWLKKRSKLKRNRG